MKKSKNTMKIVDQLVIENLRAAASFASQKDQTEVLGFLIQYQVPPFPFGGGLIQARFLRIEKGTRVSEIPLDLAWGSFLLNKVVGVWPPENIAGIRFEGDDLVVYCYSDSSDYEIPILPFGWDDYAVWRAELRSGYERWRLRRLGPPGEVEVFKSKRKIHSIAGVTQKEFEVLLAGSDILMQK